MNASNAIAIRTKSRGQGLVELALVLPVILVMSTAGFDIARVRQHQSALTGAAQAGVNYGTQLGPNFLRPTAAQIREVVRRSCMSPLIPDRVRDEDIEVDVSRTVAGQASVFVRVHYDVAPFFFNWYGDKRRGNDYHVTGESLLPVQEITVASFDPTAPDLFTINDDQTITPGTPTATSRILGADFGWEDGRLAAVFSAFSRDNGLTWEQLAGGNRVNPGNVSEQASWTPIEDTFTDLGSDNVLVFKGWSPDGYVGQVTSTQIPQVLVLRNGDPAPDFAPGFANQQSALALVGQYVDWDTNAIKLEDDEAIVLWDFNDLNGTGVDYNDLAMVVKFEQP